MKRDKNICWRKEKNTDTFVQLLLWISLPLLAMSCIAVVILGHDESAKSSLMLSTYCNQMQESCSRYFSEMKDYYLEITGSEEYRMLAEENNPWGNLAGIKSFQDAFEGKKQVGRFSIYAFINAKQGWVLGNYGMYDMAELENKGEVQNFLQKMRESPDEIVWVSNEGYGGYYNNAKYFHVVDISGCGLAIKQTNWKGELETVLFVRTDFTEIEENAAAWKQMGYQITLLADNALLLGNDKDLLQTILAEKEKLIGRGTGRLAGSYKYVSVKDKENGLVYIFSYDLNRNWKQLLKIFGAALAVMLFYSIFLYVLFHATNRMQELLGQLKNMSEKQYAQIKEYFVLNLLKGVWDGQRIAAYMKRHDFTSCASYRMIVMELGQMSVNMEEFLSKLPEKVHDLIFLEPVVYFDKMAAIVGGGDETAIEYKVAFLYKQIKQYVQEEYRASIYVGVSRAFGELTEIHTAKDECLEALMNSRKTEQGESGLAVYDDFFLRKKEKVIIRNSAEEELLEAIAVGDRKEAGKYLKKLFESDTVKGVWGIERIYFFYHLMAELLSIPQRNDIVLSEIFDEKQIFFTDTKDMLYNAELLETYLQEKIIEPMIQVMEKNRNSQSSDIVRRMMKLVRERRGDITLTECAELLHYHPGYLSRMLKKEKNMNFQDLLNMEKCNHAKHLLLNSSMSVAEIAEQLGYTNVQNFIRFFKSQEDITPAKFRKGATDER